MKVHSSIVLMQMNSGDLNHTTIVIFTSLFCDLD